MKWAITVNVLRQFGPESWEPITHVLEADDDMTLHQIAAWATQYVIVHGTPIHLTVLEGIPKPGTIDTVIGNELPQRGDHT